MKNIFILLFSFSLMFSCFERYGSDYNDTFKSDVTTTIENTYIIKTEKNCGEVGSNLSRYRCNLVKNVDFSQLLNVDEGYIRFNKFKTSNGFYTANFDKINNPFKPLKIQTITLTDVWTEDYREKGTTIDFHFQYTKDGQKWSNYIIKFDID